MSLALNYGMLGGMGGTQQNPGESLESSMKIEIGAIKKREKLLLVANVVALTLK